MSKQESALYKNCRNDPRSVPKTYGISDMYTNIVNWIKKINLTRNVNRFAMVLYVI